MPRPIPTNQGKIRGMVFPRCAPSNLLTCDNRPDGHFPCWQQLSKGGELKVALASNPTVQTPPDVLRGIVAADFNEYKQVYCPAPRLAGCRAPVRKHCMLCAA